VNAGRVDAGIERFVNWLRRCDPEVITSHDADYGFTPATINR
jgi:hypothetical protein